MSPRIGHMSDIHLGDRSGHRFTKAGLNQHEVDVAHAFRAAVEGMLAARVDLVVIAGDFFDAAIPKPAAVVEGYRQLKRLRDAGIPVVLVRGDHDKNRSVENGCMLWLFAEIGVQVVVDHPTVLDFPALGLSVTAVPDDCSVEGLKPGAASFNLLVLHGSVEGTCPGTKVDFPRSLMESPDWSFICLGHYHVRTQVGPRAWYAGSLEFTSSNIWSEIETPKGWLEIDLESGQVVPHDIPVARTICDLEPIQAAGLTADEINAQLHDRLASVDVEGAILRLKILDVPREINRLLDWKAIKGAQARALHFKVDIRKPEVTKLPNGTELHRREPLADKVKRHLSSFALAPGLNRERFVQIGTELMAQVEQEAVAKGTETRGAA